MPDFDVLVVGGGLAGLSTAWHLARAGVTRTCVLEREWACGTRASGMNAAIFRHFDEGRPGVELAVRSRVLLDTLAAPGSLLRPTGALYLGDEARLAAGEATLSALGVAHQRLSAQDIRARYPLVSPPTAGVFVPGDGVVDVHGVLAALQADLKRAGVRLRTSADVVALTHSARSGGEAGGAVFGPGPARAGGPFPDGGGSPAPEGSAAPVRHPAAGGGASSASHVAAPAGHFTVTLADGERLEAPRLVLAGGAWSAGLSQMLGLPLPLEARRRHLAVLEPTAPVDPAHPVIWRLDEEVYFRPESGGVLASPCDETAWPAGEVPVEPAELAVLGERLERLSPPLHDSRVRRAWGCLRTFAPDREFVAGADPRLAGLFWLAGLGGRGVTCGLALGEVVASAVRAQPHGLGACLAPARLV